MKTKIMLGLLLLPLLTISCSDDDEKNLMVITSKGNEISMDGVWESSCIDFTDFRLQEDLAFDGEDLVITIDQFDAATCDVVSVTEVVTIKFETLGTLDVTLDGKTVVANKVSGTQQSNGGASSSFKQSFYVVQNSGTFTLYHGVFEDDGGDTDSDGFPLEMHPFAIVRQ